MSIGAGPRMSNFPNGFANGINVRGVPLAQSHPGRAFWLYNGTNLAPQGRAGSDNNRGSFESPFATLAGALLQCVAGRGDIIFVKPGHAENISSSTALTMSVAGVAVIGLGIGTARPTFTLDTANTSTTNVSAANVSFQNCLFVPNFLSIAAVFTLTTAAGFALENCQVNDAGATLNCLNVVKSTGAANTVDGIDLCDNVWNGLGTTSVNTFFLAANDVANAKLCRNQIKLATTVDQASLAVVTAGVLTNVLVEENRIYRPSTTTANSSLINVGGTTSTGWVSRNYVQTLTTTADKLFTTTVGLAAFENRVSGVVGATGFVIPAVDS